MDYSPIIVSIAKNGEPGIIWLENAQNYSRMNGLQIIKIKGCWCDPCGETKP
jgi:hypothetical protein